METRTKTQFETVGAPAAQLEQAIKDIEQWLGNRVDADSELSPGLEGWARSVAKTFESLKRRNAGRRFGQLMEDSRQIVDYEVFITRANTGDRQPEELYEAYTVIPKLNDGSKPYARTRYDITLLSEGKTQIIKVGLGGELSVFEQCGDQPSRQVERAEAEAILTDYFHRALIAEERQSERANNSPAEAAVADADALNKAKVLTGLVGPETSLE